MTDALASAADEAWYKDAIIYQLHVKAFADANGDGIGDFAGLTEKLDYLQDLGVTALWLMPFYPSPRRDDGYDIADYRRIDPDFGSIKDFRRFMQEAKRRGLRVITELVVNHTSDQHPWFKRARRSKPGSDARNWYVWSQTDQKYLGTRIIFTDTEKSNWAWDADAGAYYWHRFFSHQPDLNYDNPRVLWAIVQVMRRWLDMGVDGFRLDAIPYLCEREGTNNENLPETHAILKALRRELDAYAPGKLFLAEANQWPEDVSAYFGDGDECHMAYHFPLMPRIYMAIAQEDRFPIADILRQTPDLPGNCQWALFLRNHDELTLEMVTDSERDYLWSTYAADPRARINLGIRRRLAPLMDNDRRKIELMNSLLFSFPGTPIIYYGDEIGMGDNIYLGDRNGVRTPMQWTPDRNGGFSRADPAKLFAPAIMDPVYGFQAVNVEAQSHNISSLLSWMKRLIAVRKSSQVFGRGTLSFVRPSNRAVLAYLRQYGGETILCVANLSRAAQAAELDLSAWRGFVPLEMLGRAKFPPITDAPFVVTLAPYGFFWFMLMEPEKGLSETPSAPPEVATVVVKEGWGEILAGRSRDIFEREVLPLMLPTRRWFCEIGTRAVNPRIVDAVTLTPGDPGFLWTVIEAGEPEGRHRYSLPLAVAWTRHEHGAAAMNAIAPARRAGREGTLIDAAGDRDFVSWLLANLHQGVTFGEHDRPLVFSPSRAFTAMETPGMGDVPVFASSEVNPREKPIRVAPPDQTNTTVFVDSRYAVKFMRRVEGGKSPEAEFGRYLTDVAGYQNTPTFLGSIELAEGDETTSLALVHAFVGNQGDTWSMTASYLDLFLEETQLLAPNAEVDPERHGAFLLRMRQIGRRVAELHAALASSTDDPAFAPEPATEADVADLHRDVLARAERTLDALAHQRNGVSEGAQAAVDALLGRRAAAADRLTAAMPSIAGLLKVRRHGNLHLGQLLNVRDDVFIIDFEGPPEHAPHDRRRKGPAARDLATLLRSLDYAGLAALGRRIPRADEEQARLAARIDEWRALSAGAIVSAYRETLGTNRLWPADRGTADALLQFFQMERLFHEIAYELAHRPSWAHIPLRGAERLLFAAEAYAA